MQSGDFFSMTHSFMHTNTVLLLDVSMELSVTSIHGFSYIQQIIPRSKLRVHCGASHLDNSSNRVLLATIRERGICPCPRCSCLKVNLDRMGLYQDMKMHEKLRVYLYDKVKLMRDWIYNQGVKIQGSCHKVCSPYHFPFLTVSTPLLVRYIIPSLSNPHRLLIHLTHLLFLPASATFFAPELYSITSLFLADQIMYI